MAFGNFALKVGKPGGKIGKVGGKAFLTYAPALIPGVGPFAAMGINAATNAANTKMEGGSWKDAAIAGGIGGATGYIGAKGIGPTGNAVAKTGGKLGTLGRVLDTATKVAPAIIGDAITSSRSRSDGTTSGIGPTAVPRSAGGIMPRGGYKYDENPLNQLDQSSPNLAMALHQGRQESLKNQPFRSGYQTNTLGTDKETVFKSQMPPIYSGFGGNKKKRQQNKEAAE